MASEMERDAEKNLRQRKDYVSDAIAFNKQNVESISFELDKSGRDGSCFEIVRKKITKLPTLHSRFAELLIHFSISPLLQNLSLEREQQHMTSR